VNQQVEKLTPACTPQKSKKKEEVQIQLLQL
jgi:hypothetical protein